MTLSLGLAVIAAVFRALGRRRIAMWALAMAVAVVYVGASGLVGDNLIGTLERRYSPLKDDSLPTVNYIVVLGSGYAPRDGIPISAALDDDGLVRIVEGVRLTRRLGSVQLVVSGGAPRGKAPPSLGYAKLAHDLGVDDALIVVLNGSLDTGAEARSVAALVGAAPFILVTSAYQMPRAVRLMQRAGARPIPAPTGQRARQTSWESFLPTSSGLGKTERALHEYLGLAALGLGIVT